MYAFAFVAVLMKLNDAPYAIFMISPYFTFVWLDLAFIPRMSHGQSINGDLDRPR